MNALTQWLSANLPAEPAKHTLVHNDFKLDNVMLDQADPTRIVAVLDWEMCTVGDPLVDVGLLLCYWPQPGDPPILQGSLSPVTMQPGWMTRAEIIERYAAESGRDLSNIDYYYIFAMFKLAVVLQQIYYRFHVGQTQDARFQDFDQRVAALVHTAFDLMQKQTA
jgi:aminoglycoside phosphotransferase (APT) family kinase protein